MNHQKPRIRLSVKVKKHFFVDSTEIMRASFMGLTNTDELRNRLPVPPRKIEIWTQWIPKLIF